MFIVKLMILKLGITLIYIKAYKAENGDAFLLNFDNKQNILIDMGTPETYETEIKNDLLNLSKNNQTIDLLVITHIDNDHIGGAIEFLKDNQSSNNIINVKEVWHNSYRHLDFEQKKVEKINKKYEDVLKNIKRRYCTHIKSIGNNDISFLQGSSLASYLYSYNYPWNISFGGNAISSEKIIEKYIGKIKIVLLSPSENKLKKLSAKWLSDMTDEAYGFELSDEDIFNEAFEFYMSNEKEQINIVNDCSSSNEINIDKLASYVGKDSSITNGSSLSFIIEYDDKKLLFLGDAHIDIVLDKLKLIINDGNKLKLDLVKVSHHGSKNNISNEILNLIECEKFLFSTNGAYHKHPDLECLAKIIKSNPKIKKELVFNYETENSKKIENDDLFEKYNYVVKYESEIYI